MTDGRAEQMSLKSSIPQKEMTHDTGDHHMHLMLKDLAGKELARAHTSFPYAPPLLRSPKLSSRVQVNRNKKSLGLSFQHKSGVEILHKLAAESDILVENYLPGSLKKYGMDYETVSKINPKLIYASITGYGQYGPYSNRAGYDVMVEAEMGLMHITGSRDGPPVKVGVAVTDLTTGLYTSNSIMAALIARGRSGRGQHIDVALSDCQVATLANMASSCLISGEKDQGRWGTAHREEPKTYFFAEANIYYSINCTLPIIQDERWRYFIRRRK